jgi:hypothetical protein
VADDSAHGRVRNELLGDHCGLRAITGVIAVDQLEAAAIDPTGFIDLIDRKLNPLEVLLPVAFLPRPGGADDEWLRLSGAARKRQNDEHLD